MSGDASYKYLHAFNLLPADQIANPGQDDHKTLIRRSYNSVRLYRNGNVSRYHVLHSKFALFLTMGIVELSRILCSHTLIPGARE